MMCICPLAGSSGYTVLILSSGDSSVPRVMRSVSELILANSSGEMLTFHSVSWSALKFKEDDQEALIRFLRSLIVSVLDILTVNLPLAGLSPWTRQARVICL